MVYDFVQATAQFLLYQLIGIGIFTTLEIFFPRERMPVRVRARGLAFALLIAPVWGLVTLLFEAAPRYLPFGPVIHLHSGFGSPIIASVALAVWIDFQFYWFHRFQHRFLWRWHSVHHSVRDLTAINGYHHWSEPLWMAAVVGVPLLLVDVDIAPTLGLLVAIFRYQAAFFIHSPNRLHLGPLRWLLIDNRYHRIHHSLQPEHHNRNFAAMTTLWDWLFGTMYMPKRDEWPEVGLDDAAEPTTIGEWSSAPWRYGRSDAVASPRATEFATR